MVYFTLFDLPRKRKGRGSDDTSRPENVTYDYGFPVPISAGIIEQVSRKADGSSNLTVSRDGSLFHAHTVGTVWFLRGRGNIQVSG